jgi:hypothetical protein
MNTHMYIHTCIHARAYTTGASVCMYLCKHTYIYTNLSVLNRELFGISHSYVYISYTHIYPYRYVPLTHTHVCKYVYIHTCIYTYIHTYDQYLWSIVTIRPRHYVHTYIHMNTYIHIYIHTCPLHSVKKDREKTNYEKVISHQKNRKTFNIKKKLSKTLTPWVLCMFDKCR